MLLRDNWKPSLQNYLLYIVMRLKPQKAINEETKEMLKDIGEYAVSLQSPVEIVEHLRSLLFYSFSAVVYCFSYQSS